MQTAYQIMIIALTSMMVINALYKNIDDWFRLRELCEEEEIDHLQEVIKNKRVWIIRHLLCAIMGVILVTAIKLTPSLEGFNLLAGLFAVHIIFSFIFAFVESLFAQRISRAISLRTVPASITHPQTGSSFPSEGEKA